MIVVDNNRDSYNMYEEYADLCDKYIGEVNVDIESVKEEVKLTFSCLKGNDRR